MNDEARRRELARFLQSRRKRLSLADAGLPEGRGPKRRTAGLRREEVAALSGISLPWYTALEQGRDIKVSDQVLESLVRTLRLDRDERIHLYALTKGQTPLDVKDGQEQTNPATQAVLDGWTRLPAYRMDARMNVMTWNRAAEALFGSFSDEGSADRNLLWRLFTQEEFRSRFVDWETIARKLLAQFRSCYARNVDDPWYPEMIGMLERISPEFADWWADHGVRCPQNGRDEFQHPQAGLLRLDASMLAEMDSPNRFLIVYTPATEQDAMKLEALLDAAPREAAALAN